MTEQVEQKPQQAEAQMIDVPKSKQSEDLEQSERVSSDDNSQRCAEDEKPRQQKTEMYVPITEVDD